MKNKILIFNTIKDNDAASHFDEIAGSRLLKGYDYTIIHLDEDAPKTDFYTHLLLTGSELSASQGSVYDSAIFRLLESFMKEEKAIYGICHGHQMIVRFLAGDKYCRRAIVPEFGYKKMEMKKDQLFTGIDIPIFLESRYDEVIDLPDDFKIIAENELEAVQAFRYQNLPVWGTQFHPEFIRKDGDPMLEKHLNENPDDRKYYRDDWKGKEYIPQSPVIFKNFAGITL